MFKMNPEAKEFIPAHILKKRQEEANRVGDLTRKLDQVDLKSENEVLNSSLEGKEKSPTTTELRQDDSHHKQNKDDGSKSEIAENRPSQSGKSSNPCATSDRKESSDGKSNGHRETEYRDEIQDLIDEEDDRFLLNAGENICEFNGEQFIIPGDDEYEPRNHAGYDFGNAEDNEDEDVCNAFEEFLENLPDQ